MDASSIISSHSATASALSTTTTARGTIDVSDMDEETLVAAPGIPLGVTDAALARYGAHIIHDPLELGVAAMACELQVAAAGVLFDENKKIG